MRTAGISPSARPEYILTAYRTAIIGVVATAFLWLLGEPRDDRVIDVLYGNDWTFFRAPLFLTLSGFFATHAAVLRRLLRPQ